MCGTLSVVGGHCILRQGALQERQGGRAAKPAVASQSPRYSWDHADTSLIPFSSRRRLLGDNGDVENLKKIFREVGEVPG